ncbi:MAG: hypothetical protein V2A54_18085 [Bacteroidota bacterium]
MKIQYFLIAAALCFSLKVKSQNQNVAINTTGNLPHASAMLDISATDKGLLIPRMTASQISAIASPATGLLVYDNNANAFKYFNGTAWTSIGGGGGGGTLNDSYNFGGAGAGRTITANSGAVEIIAPNASSVAFKSTSNNTGVAVSAESTNASNGYSVVQANTNSTVAANSAVLGNTSGAAYGVSGQVEPTATAFAGVYGSNLRTAGGVGVSGMGFNGTSGETNNIGGYGVFGANYYSTGTTGDGVGIAGVGAVGVMGQTVEGAFFGVYGENISTSTTENNVGVAGWGWVGVFGQDDGTGFGVYSDGELGSSGTKSFMIDHPLDPANKFLKHYCLESPEVLNVYRGNVTLDMNGEAVVILPNYFKEININFSYNLTAVGSAAPGLYVKEEVKENYFKVAGGKSGQKVSWTLYAERNDKYVQNKPSSKQVEVPKRAGNVGKYLRPELYGQPASKAIFQKPNTGNKSLITKTYQQPKMELITK